MVQLKLNKEVAKNFHGVSICVDMWEGRLFCCVDTRDVALSKAEVLSG